MNIFFYLLLRLIGLTLTLLCLKYLNFKGEEFWDNVLTNVIASCVFITLIFIFLKPAIFISSKIARSKPNEDNFRFKMINLSMFKITDIQISFYKCRTIDHTGFHKEYELLGTLDMNNYLPGNIKPFWALVTDSYNEFALNFRYHPSNPDNNNLIQIINDEYCSLSVEIRATHGFSGLKGTFIKKFDNSSMIKPGKFRSGLSTRIEDSIPT